MQDANAMNQPARVRFAPSPTGMMHIGGLRTALFNWLVARQSKGQFILRIEDTDQKRYDPEALQSIKRSLLWLGLEWDEGPDKGGERGPYIQTQRTQLYSKYAQTLLESGGAYLCDCSAERLESVRQQQKQNKQPPGYDGHCRERDPAEVRRSGNPAVMRIKVPAEGSIAFNDAVHGQVKFDLATITDFVAIKSDSMPTYHLAHLVDDYEMGITHVIRGEEWISSVPKHLLIHQYLNLEPPQYVHTPLLLGKDRAKLSKRHGDVAALEYERGGYIPDAVLNYLALLGCSYGDDKEIMPTSEILDKFSIQRIQKHPAIFDHDKLRWLNGQYMRSTDANALAQRMTPFLEAPAEEGGVPNEVDRPLDQQRISELIPLVQERIETFKDAPPLIGFFLTQGVDLDPALLTNKKVNAEQAAAALSAAIDICTNTQPFSPQALEDAFRNASEKLDLKPGNLFYPVRIAATGRTMAPPLFDTLAAIGRERVLQRLRNAAALL